jgi:hypothetical protein
MAKMGASDNRLTVAEKIREAEKVRDELRAALRALGIVLPSVWVESAAYGDEGTHPLIELGRCNLSTARKLIAVLRKGASRMTAASSAPDRGGDGT